MKKLSDTLREIDGQLGIKTYGAISAAADSLDEKYRLIEVLERKLESHCKFIISLGEKTSCDKTSDAVDFWRQINASSLDEMICKPDNGKLE